MSGWFGKSAPATETSNEETAKDKHSRRRSTAHEGAEDGDEDPVRLLRREKDNNKKLQALVDQQKEQFAALERKHLELTRHLSDKAEENMTLFEEKKALKMKVNELNSMEKKNEQLQKELGEKAELVQELMRRLETSGKSLSDMAREVMSLRDQHSPHAGNLHSFIRIDSYREQIQCGESNYSRPKGPNCSFRTFA